jgi:hypothetical protein
MRKQFLAVLTVLAVAEVRKTCNSSYDRIRASYCQTKANLESILPNFTVESFAQTLIALMLGKDSAYS